MESRLILIAFVCSLAVLSHAGCRRATQSDSGPTAGEPTIERVTVGRPVRKTLTLSTTQPGRIEAFQEAPLYPKLAGYVRNVLVDIGDMVQKDQLLIDLSIPELVDEVKQMQALVAQADAETSQTEAAVKSAVAASRIAQAKVAQADAGIGRATGEYERWQAEHARMTELASGGSVSQKLADESLNQFRATEAARKEALANTKAAEATLQAAQANVEKTQADVVAAKAHRQVAAANLARAKTMLEYSEIKAPFAGKITQRNVNAGYYVHPAAGANSQPLLVVMQTDKVRVFVDVPEMEGPLVDAGDKPDSAIVRVQSLGDKGIEGKVTRTSWSLDKSNRSLRVEVDLRNENGRLRPGMYATVEILLDQRKDALTLPTAAIVREGGATYCCCVESGKINRKQIELGLRSGNEVEVRSGINADELVVLARADSLQQGQRVEAIPQSQ
jgi:HlyD family secretion protein